MTEPRDPNLNLSEQDRELIARYQTHYDAGADAIRSAVEVIDVTSLGEEAAVLSILKAGDDGLKLAYDQAALEAPEAVDAVVFGGASVLKAMFPQSDTEGGVK